MSGSPSSKAGDKPAKFNLVKFWLTRFSGGVIFQFGRETYRKFQDLDWSDLIDRFPDLFG